jgi:1,4-alpha-glucan branching enzyme
VASQVWLDPYFARQDDSVTIYFDAGAGNKVLINLGPPDVYMHTGAITDRSTSAGDWRYVQGVWGTDDLPRKMRYEGKNIYSKRIHVRNFYGVPSNENILRLAFVFRNRAGDKVGRAADGSDIFVQIWPPGLRAAFLQPDAGARIGKAGDSLRLRCASSDSSNLELFLNQTLIRSGSGKSLDTLFSTLPAGQYLFTFKASAGAASAADTLLYIAGGSAISAPLPASSRDGATYLNDNSVRLTLYAPGKQSVFVTGDFNNWLPDSAYAMRRTPDGLRWWLDIGGLQKGKQYGYQYLVDGTLKVADPLSELILDPWNDGWIDKSDFPKLPSYPSGKTNGLVSVLRPGHTVYSWKHDTFRLRHPEKLNIYELHIRDFVGSHHFNTIRDTLAYLKRLGINAIEFMPLSEFEGNSSWGYNSSYHMALDKYYGNSEQLKALVDECHKHGMAVILDIVLNHAFGQSSLCHLYWDAARNQPAPDNPWLNITAKHDFNVGYDLNHESKATQDYVDRVIEYWLKEYDMDGFRFDLSKGFTQVNTLGNVAAWGRYDASRIAIWNRIKDRIRTYDSDAMLILEHFADNDEEIALSNAGFYLWGNSNHDYTEASMGFSSDVNWSDYKRRGWSKPALVAYMESHDEERMMYKNITFGNSNGSYNVKNLNTALQRGAMAAVPFFSLPGPKMIWQFGELGYEVPINFNGRTGEKPIRWEYLSQDTRRSLYNVYATMMQLRNAWPVFHTTDYNHELGGIVKKVWLQRDGHFVLSVANTDVRNQSFSIDFQATGKWYETFSGDSLTLNTRTQSITLKPGEYRLYSNVRMQAPQLPMQVEAMAASSIRVYPNPASAQLFWQTDGLPMERWQVTDLNGRTVMEGRSSSGQGALDIRGLQPGMYVLTLENSQSRAQQRFVVE